MKVLVLNCGSSTLKFDVLAIGLGGSGEAPHRLARGIVERIGRDAALSFTAEGAHALREAAAVRDHASAVGRALDWLRSVGLLDGPRGIDAVGHRVVRGGERFGAPAIVDEEIMAAIDALTELAPLHNGPALAAIRAVRAALGPEMPMVAAFDTAFHRTMPERAARYAIPSEIADRHAIRRYGFHGLAHRSMTERYAALTATPLAQTRLITLQLGNGCSAAAVAGGRSIDTSMGFTPLEGLVMGTRSGDVDPTLAGYIARCEGISLHAAEEMLNTRSGLLGVSGRTGDMQELLELERQGDARATLAIEMFCYRVRKYVGAYLAALDGAQAIVFGGGIGENAAAIRARICAGLGWCGLVLDEERNAVTSGAEGRITADDARLRAYVIAVDESAVIAEDTAACLQRAHRGRAARRTPSEE